MRGLLLAFLIATIHPVGVLATEVPTAPSREGPELFDVDSPIGRLDYRAGRGLHVGDTGLTIGGYTTADAERLEDRSSAGTLDVNFFLSVDPVSFLHLFSELEVGELAAWEGGERPRAAPKFKVERLYGDASWSDQANLRFGKFLTPFGRWNQVLADPLLWTTSEPLIVEEVFSDEVTGAMAWGTFFPAGHALSYALYGSFLDRAVSEPVHDGIGARIEWTGPSGVSVGASYLASKREHSDEWNHLGGLDAVWQPFERLELSGEALAGEGVRADGGQWGLYLQAVVETVPTLYLIGRYERFDPPASHRGIDLFDLGLTWIPRPYLRLKVDYRLADHADDLSAPGFRASFSVLFDMVRAVLAAMVLVLLGATVAIPEERSTIAVIVHPSRGAVLSADLLGQIYLRRKRFWDDGTPIVPLNLSAGAPLRQAFSDRVLRQSEARLGDYWNRQYFYGILPPATLASTEAVRRYVAADPNALGYVPVAEVDGSVRVILRLE